MLKVKNLSKKFGQTTAVCDLSLTVGAGEIYALIGPNGAGKTTTIKIIAGLYRADYGQVEFLDQDILTKEPNEKKLISYIPDEPIFYPGLTGREFLNFLAALYGVSKNKKEENLKRLLQIFSIREILDADPGGYSRGNKQKLAICAAFLTDPKFILIDEPIVGLDPQSTQAALELFSDFAKQGGGILVSTHTLSAAEVLAKRVGILDRGKLVAEGNLADLRKRAKIKTGHLEEIFLRLTRKSP